MALPIPDQYLPLQLNYGLVLLYGMATRYSPLNHFEAPADCNWATIYQMSPYGIPSYRGLGQTVLYKGAQAICTLAVGSLRLPIIEEAKLVTVELTAAPLP